MDRHEDGHVRRFQIVVGSGQTDDARALRPGSGTGSRFARLKAALMSLLMAAAVVGFAIAAIVLGSIVAVLILGVLTIVFLVALVRTALRR